MTLLDGWSFAPGIVIGIAVPAALYAVGVTRVWRAAGAGRGISIPSALMFAAAIATLIVALLSPLDELADQLQSVHMIQHLLLILVVPPLLLMGEPVRAFVWALPHPARAAVPGWIRIPFWRRLALLLTAPSAAFVLHATALLIWHAPGPYDAAVRNETIHALEHLCFLGTALLFWWVVMAPPPFRRLSIALRVPYVVGMSLVGASIGVVLTFASSPLYDAYVATAPVLGMSALEDQQLAGLIMWIPGGFAYLIAATALFMNWMKAVDARADAAPPLRVRTEVEIV
ncbi:MAG TPA: cytochrome c oxidase assembly protein [Gemmatimonadaceae bacterium]|nr:cytochrome c oxidase assembly protein [Gemmatimonadaceae bacterium]